MLKKKSYSMMLLLGLIFCLAISGPSLLLGNGGGKTVCTFDVDVKLFFRWFPGEYDNFAQFKEDEFNKIPNPHPHVHSLFAPVEVPALGAHVFFTRQHEGGNPQKVFRCRLYSFNPDKKEKAIILSIYAFKDESTFKDAHLKPEILKDLTMEQLKPFPGCEVYFRLEGEFFVGKSKHGQCTFKSSRSGRMLTIFEVIRVGREELQVLEDIADKETGKRIVGRDDGIPSIQKRCRFYEGWAVIEDKSGDTDSDKKDTPGKADKVDTTDAPKKTGKPAKAKRKYHVIKNIRLHDQGQRVPLITANGIDTGYELELAQLNYSGSNADVLKLGIFEKGETKKSKFYIWGEPKAKRLGLNLKWFQAGVTLIENSTKSKKK